MHIVCIFGTRPEAIKMAPVVKALQCHPDKITTRVWVTAQHRQMLDQVLELFGIQPDLDLNLMQNGQTPSKVAALVLQQLEPHLMNEKPDWVLVQGDTTTVMATAIAAHHLRIKVGHVEAGLRTHDKANPFPEEMNRVIADALSDLHFVPTQRARANLLSEGIADTSIQVTGNTVIDALQWVVQQPATRDVESLLGRLGIQQASESVNLQREGERENGRESERSSLLPRSRAHRLILVTAHRRESFG